MLLLPFEPRPPVLESAGLKITLLELAAAVAFAVLAWCGRSRLRELARRPPLPLALLTAYAGVHVLSAVLAPENAHSALKFSLRTLAMAGFAWTVAASPANARRRALQALTASAAAVAVLAILEGLGVRPLDPFLSRFRET